MMKKLNPILVLLVVGALVGCDSQMASPDTGSDAIAYAKGGNGNGGGGNNGGGTDLPAMDVAVASSIDGLTGTGGRIGTGWAVAFYNHNPPTWDYDRATAASCPGYTFDLLEVQGGGGQLYKVNLWGDDGAGTGVKSGWVDFSPPVDVPTDLSEPFTFVVHVETDLAIYPRKGKNDAVCTVYVGSLTYTLK